MFGDPVLALFLLPVAAILLIIRVSGMLRDQTKAHVVLCFVTLIVIFPALGYLAAAVGNATGS